MTDKTKTKNKSKQEINEMKNKKAHQVRQKGHNRTSND